MHASFGEIPIPQYSTNTHYFYTLFLYALFSS